MTLSTTVECLKKESKQKEDKYLDEVINLQNKNKALYNVVYKMGQSTQTMNMLTKPQAFYDESHKTALGYQNPFYLSQAQRKVLALYDGHTIVKTHVALSVTDTKETLELAKENVMNTVMHANDHYDNVLPANNNSLEHDNSALELLKHENDRLIELLISQDLVHTAVNTLATINDYKTMQQSFMDEYNKTLVLKAELGKKNDMIEKAVYNELLKRCSGLKKRRISLETKLQQSKESFQTKRPSHNQDAPEFKEFFIINELQVQLKAKNVLIEKLKEHIANIKGKNVVKSVQNVHNSNVVTSKVYKLDLPPLYHCIKNNMVAHELLVYVSATCPSSKHVSDKFVAVTPMNRTGKVRIAESNDTLKDKTQKQCIFDAIHDLYVSDYLNDVNAHVKSKSVKSRSAKRKKKKMWKPTGKVYTNVGYSWKPTGRIFTIDGNLAKQGLVRGLPKLKFEKDHLCSECSLRKSKKSSHKPKADDTNQEKLYLLHMDMCGPMRVKSINGKKYILVIIDDYSRFTWVKLLRSKNEAPEAEAVSIACYTQNRSVIRLRYNKTPYELLHKKKPDLSFLYVFGSLCYPTNDSEDLVKLKPKADIFSSGLAPQLITPGTLSLGLMPNHIPQLPNVPPTKNDWDIFFQPMFDEFFNPPPSVVSPVPIDAAPRPVDPTGSPVSTSIDQDAPSTSNPSTQEQEKSLIIFQGVEESPKTPHFHDDPIHETLHEDSTSQGSSSNVRSSHTPLELLIKRTKNHPLENVIGDPSRSVSTRKKLNTDAMWCYFDAFLTLVEQKNCKEAMLESSWIDAMQEEIHEFEPL
ncbi:putative ribonuclease H-like domain-containing protein [Tanacetum coccineum]